MNTRVLQRLGIQLVQLGVDEALEGVLQDLLGLLEDLHKNLLQARVEGRFAGLGQLQVLLVPLEHRHEELRLQLNQLLIVQADQLEQECLYGHFIAHDLEHRLG